MPLATVKGKAHALKKLAERREKYKDKKPIDNSSLYAGSAMYFDCPGCNGPIVVPESYITKPEFCRECQALVNIGWME